MTNTGINIIKTNLTKNIEYYSDSLSYNRKRIFKRAWYLVRTERKTLKQALKQVWGEWKRSVANARKEVSILKAKLNRLFTPIQYHQTSEYAHQQMIAAHNRGTNLNTL